MGLDIIMEFAYVHDKGSSEDNVLEERGSEGSRKLIGSENGAQILRINGTEARIPLFRIDVPSSSQSIRFSSEFSGSEPDNHIEMAKVFGPPDLPTCYARAHSFPSLPRLSGLVRLLPSVRTPSYGVRIRPEHVRPTRTRVLPSPMRRA